MGTLTVSGLSPINNGSQGGVEGVFAFGSSYATGGESTTAQALGLSRISRIELMPTEGYVLGVTYSSPTAIKISAWITAGFTPEGTAAAQTFTGTASTTGEISAFTGTGQSSAGQVITTTDNQTMTLNECAGMWFLSATHGPYYIVSNTAVTGAPAVLTVIGDAPTTDAGAYRIVKSPTPAGTNSTSTLTGTAVAAAALSEVANATNLSTPLASVKFKAWGY